MFYFYLTIAYYSFLSLFVQLLLLKVGYVGVLGSFAMNLFLTFAFTALAIKKFKCQHEYTKLGTMVGAWFAVFGLATFFLRENYINAFTFCLGLLATCIFTSYGLIIILYNRAGKTSIAEVSEEDDGENVTDLIYSVIFKIDVMNRNPRIQLSRRFASRLYNCQVYLLELNRIHYPIRKALLEQVLDLLQTYQDLKESLIPTQHGVKTLERIEESFDRVEEALSNMYTSFADTKLEEAEIKTEVLESYLDLNGYLDDRFELEEGEDF